MTRSKKEVIRKVADEFVKNLSAEYFKGKSEQIDLIVRNGDPSVVNRLLDKIQLSTETTQEYYDLAMSVEDPVKEVLEPVIVAIANNMFTGWLQKDLQSGIKDNIPKYDEVTRLFSTTKDFQATWIRSIAACCNALLADKLTLKIQGMMAEKDRLENADEKESIRKQMDEESQQFAQSISIPFDNYIKKIDSPVLLYSTWLRYLYQGLLNIMSFFSGKQLTIEEKVDGLYLAAKTAKEKLNDYLTALSADSEAREPLLSLGVRLEKLMENLSRIASEIQTKKEMNMDYVDYANSDFASVSQEFARFVHAQQSNLPQLEKPNALVIQEIIKTLLRDNPLLAEKVTNESNRSKQEKKEDLTEGYEMTSKFKK